MNFLRVKESKIHIISFKVNDWQVCCRHHALWTDLEAARTPAGAAAQRSRQVNHLTLLVVHDLHVEWTGWAAAVPCAAASICEKRDFIDWKWEAIIIIFTEFNKTLPLIRVQPKGNYSQISETIQEIIFTSIFCLWMYDFCLQFPAYEKLWIAYIQPMQVKTGLT